MSNLLSALTAKGEGYGYKIFGLSQRLSPISFTPTTSSPLPIKRASQLRLFVSAKDNRRDSLLQSPLTTGIVFIDPNIDDYETLLAGVKPGLEVVLLDGNRDGITQITEVLQKHRGLLSLHIVAHGEVGGLWLGSEFFGNNTFDQYINDVASWRTALAPDGDILLYGCNVAAGETGREFVQRLSELTGADVAASDDLTGSAELGGDWDLEVKVGDVEAALAFRVEVMESYGGVLMANVNFGAPSYSTIEGTTDIAVNIPITLSGFRFGPVFVPILINGISTATPGQDYTLSNSFVIFPPGFGSPTRNVTVIIKPDNIPENAETVVLRFGPIFGAIPGSTNQTVLTIAPNDTIFYGVTAGTSTVTEGNSGSTPIAFTVNRSGGIDAASSVNYTIGGSATNGSDYTGSGGGTINFAPGETSRTITMNVLGDTIPELHETIAVTLSNPVAPGPTPIINSAVATTTIINDDVETPGDTLATARNSGLSSANPGTFNLNAQIGDNPNVAPTSDVDMVAFQLDAGGRVTIDIDANQNGIPLDSVLRIFNSSGQQLAVSDDTPAPGESFSLDSYLDFTATQTGTYYVGVSSFANFSYNPNVAGSGTGGSTGNYNLQMTVLETPGDTLATARQSGLTSANPGIFNLNARIGDNPNVAPTSDVDMVAFQLDAGGRVTIDIDANQNGIPLDSVLRIFNSSGQQLAVSDDTPAPGEPFSLDSYLDFTATQTGTYYVGVSSYSNFNYNPNVAGSGTGGSTGNYNLQINMFETPGDTLATARQSGLTSANPGTFNLSSQIGNNPNVSRLSDVDMVAFQLDAGGQVTIDIDANQNGSPLDSVLRIFNSSGQEVAFSDDNAAPGEGASLDSYLNFTATQAGTYYVGVSGYCNDDYNPTVAGSGIGQTTGNYNLQMTVLETPGDTLATARQSGLSSANPGTFNLSSRIGNNPNVSNNSDVDMIAFQLDAGGRVTIDIDARINTPSSPLDSVLRIFDSNGNQLAVSDDNTAPGEPFTFDSYLDFTATQTGTYYVGVSSFANFSYNPTVAGSGTGRSTGNYNLQMNVLETPGDTLATARQSGLSSLNNGTFVLNSRIGDNPNVSSTADVDMIAFQANAGGRVIVNIDASQNGSSLDSVLRIFNSSGQQLALNDDNAAPGETFSLDSYLSFTPTQTGTYYVGVSGYRNFFYNPSVAGSGSGFSTGNYNLQLSVVSNTISGTQFSDTLYGTSASEAIYGLAGNDTIYANEGNNAVYGGAGNDTLYAGNGNDVIDGGADNDTIYANEGNNTVNGGTGNDSLYAGNGDDRLDGGDGNDTIYANEGNNNITGGAGIDTIYAGNGNDVIDAGADNDLIYANGGNNTINGGAGIDTIYAGNGNDIIDAGADNDTIYANDGNNRINGGTGNDLIYTSSGKDIINGGDGNDTIYSGDGNDCITGGFGNDTIYAGAGDDLINGGIGNDILWLGSGRDIVTLESGIGFDTINGFQLNQTTFHLGVGLSANNLTIFNSANGAEIYAGSDRLAVVSWTQASVIQNNLSSIFV